MRIEGRLVLPKMAGTEVSPGVCLIEEPRPCPDLGPNKMTCLADVRGYLCIVELSVRFLPPDGLHALP